MYTLRSNKNQEATFRRRNLLLVILFSCRLIVTYYALNYIYLILYFTLFLQALDSRDSMAMNLYACTFKWLINKINQRIKGNNSFSSIGVLDIFGFENFDVSYLALS